jgi:hypothetical protein
LPFTGNAADIKTLSLLLVSVEPALSFSLLDITKEVSRTERSLIIILETPFEFPVESNSHVFQFSLSPRQPLPLRPAIYTVGSQTKKGFKCAFIQVPPSLPVKKVMLLYGLVSVKNRRKM